MPGWSGLLFSAVLQSFSIYLEPGGEKDRFAGLHVIAVDFKGLHNAIADKTNGRKRRSGDQSSEPGFEAPHRMSGRRPPDGPLARLSPNSNRPPLSPSFVFNRFRPPVYQSTTILSSGARTVEGSRFFFRRIFQWPFFGCLTLYRVFGRLRCMAQD